MEKKELQIVYNTLLQYWREYNGAGNNTQSRIEDSVRAYANTLPGDIYLLLNQGSASGLFRHGFFLNDLERSLTILHEELEE